MAVGRLEPRPSLAEVHLARDAGPDHPLECPVDRGASDARGFAANQIEEIVRADMALLAQKDLQNAIAL